jgi:rare lipoprotein A
MMTRLLAPLLTAVALLLSASCGARKPVKAVTPKIGQKQRGIASWYGHPYHGRRTASGEIYDMEQMTAAHRNWAFNTWVRVHNLDNGRVTEVRITDRGPFVRGRIIDLSRAAARSVDMIGPGLARVQLEVIRPPAQAPAPPPPASPAPRPSPPPTAPPASSPSWGVQVASFADHERARRLYQRLLPSYPQLRLTLSPAGYWRVVVGVARSPAAAEELRQKLLTEFPDAFVVRFDDIT